MSTSPRKRPAPVLLPFVRPQPEPIGVFTMNVRTPSGFKTAIAREWGSADAAEACQLCPEEHCMCTATGMCLVLADRVVEYDEAGLYQFPG